jgi:hypothetical protein
MDKKFTLEITVGNILFLIVFFTLFGLAFFH